MKLLLQSADLKTFTYLTGIYIALNKRAKLRKVSVNVSDYNKINVVPCDNWCAVGGL
jgi:hypothetical protein